MIKKVSINKILRYSALLIIVFLFYLFPKKDSITLENVTVMKENYAKTHDIFLIDKEKYVSKTKIPIISKNQDDLIEELFEALIKDGKYENKIPNGFTAVLPSDSYIISKKVEDGVLHLNLNKHSYEVIVEEEDLLLESLIYTMTSIDGINKLKLYLDNEEIKEFPNSNNKIDTILSRDFGINKKYNIIDFHNVTKVTIYYVNKNNVNQTYYVPVTKYVNNKNEKIKIIIDELTSKISYESDLMSYLNYNTKLLDYSINGDEINLNFNEYLFDDKDNKKVLEEVIYSISYSIMDNYEVSKVNFYVNNKEI